MIKSMTTTARRRSSLAKSPMLPRINNGKRGRRSKNVPDTKSSAASLGDLSKSSSVNSWPTRGPGYRNFSEHRVQAAPRKKQDQTLKFMKHSLIKQTALGFQITQTISPLRTSNPSKSFPTSRKIDYRKKPQSKGEVKTTKVPQTELPLLSVMKIGTLRYSGRGRGGRQPEVKCSILGTN